MSERNFSKQSGVITPVILIILAVFFVSATAIMGWSFQERRGVIQEMRDTKVLQVAEAGIDYYKWHLAHNSDDFQDGEDWCCENNTSISVADCGGVCGPYTEIYKDYDGNEIGEFVLLITPPSVGSTIVEINSVGKIYEDNNVEKGVTAKIGKTSLARYSLLSDSPIWIGPDESTSGPLHSNGGIRFDGTCDAEVTSAVETYNGDSAYHGFTGIKPGIWGSANASCQQYWDYPVSNIDFDLFTLNMATIKSDSQIEGIYLDSSGEEGYHLVFLSTGKIAIYRVDSVGKPTKYINDDNEVVSDNEGIKKETFLGNYDMPINGLVFVEDDIWVEGVVNGRVTVAVSKFSDNSSSYARIIINDDITYLQRNGDNVLGLMAEGDVLVPRHVSAPLVIDAVLLSQKSHVYVRNYNSNYKVKKDGSIQVYGGIISDLFWTWSYVSGGNVVDGFTNTEMIYDSYLTFSPPPSFPTEENFEVISWAEDR
ncbi:MAG: hypothetical protein WC178_03945 [Candidatus Paceibacterota bacterium]